MKFTHITPDEFLSLVQSEIDSLRMNMTDEEKDKINFETINTDKDSECLYGQSTGNYKSERALQLHSKNFDLELLINKNDIELEEGEKYTPLEVYFFIIGNVKIENFGFFGRISSTKNEKTKDVIDYIKGEIPAINLSL